MASTSPSILTSWAHPHNQVERWHGTRHFSAIPMGLRFNGHHHAIHVISWHIWPNLAWKNSDSRSARAGFSKALPMTGLAADLLAAMIVAFCGLLVAANTPLVVVGWLFVYLIDP